MKSAWDRPARQGHHPVEPDQLLRGQLRLQRLVEVAMLVEDLQVPDLEGGGFRVDTSGIDPEPEDVFHFAEELYSRFPEFPDLRA
jgi:hypothetical protein